MIHIYRYCTPLTFFEKPESTKSTSMIQTSLHAVDERVHWVIQRDRVGFSNPEHLAAYADVATAYAELGKWAADPTTTESMRGLLVKLQETIKDLPSEHAMGWGTYASAINERRN